MLKYRDYHVKNTSRLKIPYIYLNPVYLFKSLFSILNPFEKIPLFDFSYFLRFKILKNPIPDLKPTLTLIGKFEKSI